MGRAPCCDKATVKKGPWSPEEDAKLKAYIDENGTGGNWIALPQKIGTPLLSLSSSTPEYHISLGGGRPVVIFFRCADL